MSKERRTLLWLIFGIFIYAAGTSVIGAIFLHDAIRFTLGVFWSSCGACIVAIHLYNSLQRSLDLDEKGAAKREATQALIRMLIMIMVVAIGLVLRNWFHPVGVIVGMFALKVSAYVQPFFIRQPELQ